jgi:CheY-like chemotaxis protein
MDLLTALAMNLITEIILADDDDGHAELIKRNLVRSGVVNDITRVFDGQDCLDFIRREGPYADKPPIVSFLLLLDINMPRVDGIRVLKELKQDNRWKSSPIIVLTTTDDPAEIDRCYEAGCNVYLTKPVTPEGFIEAIKRLGLFLQIIQISHAG